MTMCLISAVTFYSKKKQLLLKILTTGIE